MSRNLHLLRRMRFCAFLIVVLFTFTVFAEDLMPPYWRGFDGSTYAKWEFDSPSKTPSFDEGFNPFGKSQIYVFPEAGYSWLDEKYGAEGVWPLLGGRMYAVIDNRPESTPKKQIQIQLTWKSACGDNAPVITINDNLDLYVCGIVPDVVEPLADNPLWNYSVYTITWPYNPAREWIKIAGRIYVDELVIDTICSVGNIPEPTTYMILTAGAFLLFKAGRK